jgi:hypothetical protein
LAIVLPLRKFCIQKQSCAIQLAHDSTGSIDGNIVGKISNLREDLIHENSEQNMAENMEIKITMMNKAYLAYLNRLLVQETEAQRRRTGIHTMLEPVRMQNRRWCCRR